MEYYEEIDIEELSDEEIAEFPNTIQMYFNELSKYPLLTVEEEKKYVEDLKAIDQVKLKTVEDVEGYRKIDIDLEQLFVELENKGDLYQEIISSLLPVYRNDENKYKQAIYDALKEYRKQARKLGRALHREEYQSILSISPIKLSYMSKKELLEEVKNFVIYKNAENKLFCCNLRLVIDVASKYAQGVELLDAIADGNFGLLKAIEKFDTSFETKFSTYAVYWIKQNIDKRRGNYRSGCSMPLHVERELNG